MNLTDKDKKRMRKIAKKLAISSNSYCGDFSYSNSRNEVRNSRRGIIKARVISNIAKPWYGFHGMTNNIGRGV